MKLFLNTTVSQGLGHEQNWEAFKSTDQLIQQGGVARFSNMGSKGDFARELHPYCQEIPLLCGWYLTCGISQ